MAYFLSVHSPHYHKIFKCVCLLRSRKRKWNFLTHQQHTTLFILINCIYKKDHKHSIITFVFVILFLVLPGFFVIHFTNPFIQPTNQTAGIDVCLPKLTFLLRNFLWALPICRVCQCLWCHWPFSFGKLFIHYCWSFVDVDLAKV